VLLDDHLGLQLLTSASTPLDITGHAAAATVLLEKVEGAGNLEVQLLRIVGTDSVSVASASGPRLSAQSNRRMEWAAFRRP
jgi:hypothetical protein